MKKKDFENNSSIKLKPQYNFDREVLGEAIPLEAPYVIYIESSSYCNLECKFCPQHISPGDLVKKNMSVDLFKKFVNDLKEFKGKPKLIRFCGTGDSLFNKNFVDIVEISYQKKIADRLELITNGILLNDKIIPKLGKYLDRVIISIEGLDDADYEKYTLRKVNFNNLVKKLKKFSENKTNAKLHIKIHNSAVLTEDRTEKFFDIFSDIADEIYIENLVNLWPEVESNLGLESGQRFDGKDLNKVKVCPQIFKSMQINSDGRVIPCCIDFKTANLIGDLNKESVKNIWNGQELHTLRMKHLDGKRHEFSPCKGCTMNEYSDKDNIDKYSEQIKNKINL